MIKQFKPFDWACFQSKNRDQDQNQEQINKYGIFRKTRYFGGLAGQSQPKPDNDNDDPINSSSRGIFFNHIDNSELSHNGFSESYPLGHMIEHYDIERENEMCLNENNCSLQADVF